MGPRIKCKLFLLFPIFLFFYNPYSLLYPHSTWRRGQILCGYMGVTVLAHTHTWEREIQNRLFIFPNPSIHLPNIAYRESGTGASAKLIHLPAALIRCTAVVAMAPLETLVHPGYAQENHVEETIVTFDPMVTDDLLEAYVKVPSPPPPPLYTCSRHDTNEPQTRQEKVPIKPVSPPV